MLDQAAERFVADVVVPTAAQPRGLPRLRALVDRWVDYLAEGLFQYGCFITARRARCTGSRGPLRHRTMDIVDGWRELLGDQVRSAQALATSRPTATRTTW